MPSRDVFFFTITSLQAALRQELQNLNNSFLEALYVDRPDFAQITENFYHECARVIGNGLHFKGRQEISTGYLYWLHTTIENHCIAVTEVHTIGENFVVERGFSDVVTVDNNEMNFNYLIVREKCGDRWLIRDECGAEFHNFVDF